MCQFLRRLGALAFGEVGRRAHDGHPEVGTDAHRYHVLGDELRPNTCVDLLRNDVGEPVVDHNLNVDVGVLW